MNWQKIKVSSDNTHFLYDGEPIFDKNFIEILKFHAPGLAPVKDETGAYHIDTAGNPLYLERYSRTFGFYCNRATIIKKEGWFHINEKGKEAYVQNYTWAGNFQENICTVRDSGAYFHIDLHGNRLYSENYLYAGDYKDGIACVKQQNSFFIHIDISGKAVNDKEFLDLGVFHKNFATAKDKNGWFHINKSGNEIYNQRYSAIEPFYNGFALVTLFDDVKVIIDESGELVHSI
jgi:hypothetical protein